MHVGVTFSLGKINFLLHCNDGIIHLFGGGGVKQKSSSGQWSVDAACIYRFYQRLA